MCNYLKQSVTCAHIRILPPQVFRLLDVLCTVYNSLWCIVDSYIAVYMFIKRCHVYFFFLLTCRKSCKVGKEGIVSIVILKLRNLRLVLVPTCPYPIAA